MYNNADLPTFHHPSNDCSTSDPFSGSPRESKNEGSDSEADPLCEAIDPLFDAYCSSQDSNPPNALGESVDWRTISSWTPGVITPSYQEVLEGTVVFDAVSTTYPVYSDTNFDQELPPATHESMTNTGAGNYSVGVLEEMERQSFPGMTYMERSPSGPSSALSDRDGLTAWSRPGHTPSPSSDHCHHDSLGLLSNPLEHAPSRRSTKRIPEDGETTLTLRPVGGTPTVIHKPNTDIITSLLLSPSISWHKIPQERYTQRKRDRSFLQLREITFSVNNIRGFSMQNAFGRVFTGLDGRDDPVLENANGPVSCRLLFPGYPPNTRCSQIAVRNWKKESAPITRSKLTYEIAKRVKRYTDALATIPINPSTNARWTIGQGYMKFEKMYLVSVAWVSKGSLQPEIWVDTDGS
ncbi:hypothetical protein BDM02DRAFT_3186208 [Thelephora ganbajun]|uniref:Uncharacterized protein n=1 Tax=Thelephora ganbajun TaxID=370292 RepID=A0ACB6ZJ21_THEGA|nr:hypothetical protein BDM02DRAFT_3186208 [Thelephora ganbajun]